MLKGLHVSSKDDEPDPPRNFTIEQLNEFNGTTDDKGREKPTHIALNGIVFDVSNAKTFFGPDGDGNKFAGDECGIELAKHLHKNLNMNIDDMLQRLITKYSNCYPILGKVVPSNSIPSSERIVSPQELLQNNGSSSNDLPEEGGYATLPIYVALRNKVYDVSFGGVSMYGPGGPYHKFAGRDISRALAKMSFEPEDLDNTDISDLTDRQIGVLDDWIKTYENKKLYPIVGMLNK